MKYTFISSIFFYLHKAILITWITYFNFPNISIYYIIYYNYILFHKFIHLAQLPLVNFKSYYYILTHNTCIYYLLLQKNTYHINSKFISTNTSGRFHYSYYTGWMHKNMFLNTFGKHNKQKQNKLLENLLSHILNRSNESVFFHYISYFKY